MTVDSLCYSNSRILGDTNREKKRCSERNGGYHRIEFSTRIEFKMIDFFKISDIPEILRFKNFSLNSN